MLRWLNKRLTRPTSASGTDPETSTLQFILLALLAASLPSCVLLVRHGDPGKLVALACVDAVFVASLWLIRHGHLVAPRLAVPLSLLVVITYLVASSNGGIHDITAFGYMMVVASAGLTLGKNAPMVFAGLSLAALSGIYVAEASGILKTRYGASSSPDDIVTIGIFLAISAVSMRVMITRMLDSLGRAQRNEETLARRNRELQASQEEIEALNAALERRVSERTRDLQVAADVSRQITTIHDRTLLLEQVVERTREAFGLYYVGIFLYNAARREAVFFQGTGQEGRTLKQEHITFREAGSGLIARAMRIRQPILVKDIFVEPDFLPSPPLPETGSELVLPMIVGTKLIGVLDLQDRQTSRFSADDMRVLTALAEQIGIAIENAQLFDEVQAARRESETLYHISEAINNATSNKTIVQAVALELGAVPYNVVLSIFEHHDYGRASFLEAVAIRPVGQAQTNSISIRHPLPPVRPSPGSLLVIENTETQPEHPMAHYFKADGIRAVLSAAVVFGGRIIGLLSFNSPQPYIFSAFERRLVRGVADLAAAAIERSGLLAEAHATREEAEILYRIGESINATTSYLEIVDAIARYDTGATKSTIALSVFEDFDYKRATYADIVAIRAAGQTQALAATMRFSVLPLPLVKGEILIIEDVGSLTRDIAEAWEAMNINSVMICPIALGERIIGTLSFATTVPRTYSQLERRLIRGSADLAAAAIERSHLLNQARTKPAPR